jgi:hypothetical protein
MDHHMLDFPLRDVPDVLQDGFQIALYFLLLHAAFRFNPPNFHPVS